MRTFSTSHFGQKVPADMLSSQVKAAYPEARKPRAGVTRQQWNPASLGFRGQGYMADVGCVGLAMLALVPAGLQFGDPVWM